MNQEHWWLRLKKVIPRANKPRPDWRRPESKEIVIGFGVLAVLAGAAVPLSKWLSSHFTHTPVVSRVVVHPKPPKTTEPSRLTGVEIPIEVNKRAVTGVMIENSPDARPQAGLHAAGIVFEAVAEGGITRFLALFLEGQPDNIGPVRSVRPYYLDFLAPFDAAIAHAGGSGLALAQIREQGIKDLDHGANGGAFRRSDQRYAPHNLYTSMGSLDEASRSRGFTSSSFNSFGRKKETPSAEVSARSINLGMAGPLYNVHYDYDQPTNSYKRVLAGEPHYDAGGQQLNPKVVVALVMGHHYEGIYSVYGTTGGNKMIVFQDGTRQEGEWVKADRKSQFSLKDAAGNPLRLNPGQTWITIVDSPDSVTSSP